MNSDLRKLLNLDGYSIIKNAWRDVKLNRVDFKPDVLKVISICNEKAIKDQIPRAFSKIILSFSTVSVSQHTWGWLSINHWRVNIALAKWIFNFGSFKAQIKLPQCSKISKKKIAILDTYLFFKLLIFRNVAALY